VKPASIDIRIKGNKIIKATKPKRSAFPKPCLCSPNERKNEAKLGLRPHTNHNEPSGKMTNQSHFAMSFARMPPPFVIKLSTIKTTYHPTAIHHSIAGWVIFKTAGICSRERNTTKAIAKMVPVGIRMVDSHSAEISGKAAKATPKITTNPHRKGSNHHRDGLITG